MCDLQFGKLRWFGCLVKTIRVPESRSDCFKAFRILGSRPMMTKQNVVWFLLRNGLELASELLVYRQEHSKRILVSWLLSSVIKGHCIRSRGQNFMILWPTPQCAEAEVNILVSRLGWPWGLNIWWHGILWEKTVRVFNPLCQSARMGFGALRCSAAHHRAPCWVVFDATYRKMPHHNAV